MKLLYIEWFDAYTPSSGWHDQQDVIKEVIDAMDDYAVSVGFLIHEDKQRIVLASSRFSKASSDTDIDGIISIPKGMIRKKRILR